MSVNGCTRQRPSSTNNPGAVNVREQKSSENSEVSATKTPAIHLLQTQRKTLISVLREFAGNRALPVCRLTVTDLVPGHLSPSRSLFCPQLCRRRSFDESTVVDYRLNDPSWNRCCSLLCLRVDDSGRAHLGHRPDMKSHSTTLEVLTLEHGLLVADSALKNACQAI